MRSIPSICVPGRRGFVLTASALVGLAGLMPGGCVSASDRRDDPIRAASRSGEIDPLGSLRRLAAEQEVRPDQQALATPVPSSIPQPPAAASDRLRAPLEEARRTLGTSAPVTRSPAEISPPPRQPSTIEASKLYVSGRSHLLASRITDAIADLEAASRLDPDSVAILADLAQAQAASGRRPAATATYRRAVSLGLRDARVAAFLGRETLRGRQFERAAAELILADQLAEQEGARLTGAVARADLADALFNLGYVKAAADCLSSTLEGLPLEIRGPLKPEEAELLRRRSDMWRRAGDLHASLGDLREANIAYVAAASFPGGDSDALTQRRLYALLASGRSAQAAVDLLESLRGKGVIATGGQLDLLRSLIRQSSIGRDILDACVAVACDRVTTTMPSGMRHDLVVAAASEAPATDARRALDAWMRQSSEPVRAAASFAALHGDDAAACAQAFAALCVARPEWAPAFAQTILESGRGVGDVIAWCRRRPSDPGAWMLLQCLTSGMPASSHPLTPPPAGIDVHAARFVTAVTRARRGMWSDVDAAIEGLAVAGRPELFSRALAASQRLGEAVVAARGVDAVTGLTLASWQLDIGDPAAAASTLRACIEVDPTDERPYEALITLLSPKAPLADESGLAEVAKRLRDNVPDSRFARGIAARDLASRSQWTAATDALLGLLDPHEENTTVLSMLVAVAERSRSSDPGCHARIEAAIDGRLGTRPDAAELVLAKARLLAARPDGAARAESLLAEAWNRVPLPATARLRESIVRDLMQDASRAEAMSRARLAPAPRAIDDTIEYAQLLAGSAEYESAGGIIADGLPQRIPLTAAQSARLVALASELRPERLMDSTVASSAAALSLFDQVAARGLTMTPQMHVTRLLLLCAATPSDSSRLATAVERATERTPELAMSMSVRVAQLLLSKPDPSDGLSFLIEMINRTPQDREEIAFSYEVFRVTLTRGDAADVDACVDRLGDPGAMLRAVAATIDNDEVRVPATEAQRRAELAYWLGNGLSVEQREDLAEHAYRLAIRLDPSHAWALNNLGYNLLERGGDSMTEAAWMIERAFASLSDEPSVIDSMGWLRYKQGRFEDRRLPDGTLEEGAGSLLSKAVNHPDGSPSAEQSDHFGDVLWRLGRRKEAQAQWDTARRLLESQLSLYRASREEADQPRPLEKFLSARMEAVAAKLSTAARGESPPIAPTDEESRAGTRP
jgi:tetratricopeptide (TPR) repeat protein